MKTKIKKRLLFVLFTFLIIASVFAQGKIRLKIATIAPTRSPWDIQLKRLAQDWYKITNGQVSIKFQDMNTLGGEKGGIQRMRSTRPGQRPMVDGAILSPVGLNDLAPKAKIFTLSSPFLIQNQKELNLVLKKYGNAFEKEIEAEGYELLTWSNVGWLSFYTKQSYSSLKELKQLKVACANDTQDFTDILTICGFNAYAIPPSKYNQVIKSSTGAEGFTGVHILAYSAGLYKDISYILDSRICPVMAGFVISKESWKRIPDKYKDEMLRAVEKMRQSLNQDLEKMENEYLAKMKTAGIKMIPLTPNQKKEWDKEFYKDMEKVNNIKPHILNMEIYKKISQLLETY